MAGLQIINETELFDLLGVSKDAAVDEAKGAVEDEEMDTDLELERTPSTKKVTC